MSNKYRRRRNFFMGRYAVRTYPFGKANARGDRNVKESRFRNEDQARRWAAGQTDYPEVEVVDLRSGDILFTGGTGKTWNPKSKRKRSKRKPHARSRDWIAVHAKGLTGRKGAGSHRDKSRYTRKKKHKGRSRYNPERSYMVPHGVDPKVFDSTVKMAANKAMGEYRGIISALLKAQAVDVPEASELADLAQVRAVAVVSAGYPDVPGQAMASLGPAAMADRLLALDADGRYDDFVPFRKKYKDVFAGVRERLIDDIKSARRRAAAKKGAATKLVSAAKEQQALQARKDELMEERAQLTLVQGGVQEADPTEAEYELVDETEEVDHARESEARRRKKKLAAAERLGDRADFRARTRRRDVRPPSAVLAEAEQDVLLFWLADGSTQVWAKGAITETFLPFKRKSSLKIAYEYAQDWRGLDQRGKLKPRAKKSRLRSRILVAVEGGGDEYVVKAPAVLEAEASREVTKRLDDVTMAKAKEILKLKNPRRRRRNPRRPRRRR